MQRLVAGQGGFAVAETCEPKGHSFAQRRLSRIDRTHSLSAEHG